MRSESWHFVDKKWFLFQKKDLLLYPVFFLLLTATVYFGVTATAGKMIEVRIKGRVQYRFSLEEDGTKIIENDGAKLMTLVIEHSDAHIIHSQCPLHLCERGMLKQSGVLVCVPQKVIITIVDRQEPVKKNGGIDLITG